MCSYYKEGIQQFNMLRKQRSRIFSLLNGSQRQFINYLGRASNQQAKINEFCESFNRFTEEFPELRDNA